MYATRKWENASILLISTGLRLVHEKGQLILIWAININMAIEYPKFRYNAVIPANAGIQGFQYITGFPDEPGSSTGSEFIPL